MFSQTKTAMNQPNLLILLTNVESDAYIAFRPLFRKMTPIINVVNKISLSGVPYEKSHIFGYTRSDCMKGLGSLNSIFMQHLRKRPALNAI
jgi:predicted GTPase